MLVVGLIGSRPHLHELRGIARRVGAIVGIVVGDLVIVPGRQPREGGVGGLQVGIELVEGVAVAELRQGRRDADRVLAHQPGPPRLFVDVVAEMHDEIEIAVGHVAIGSEVALLVLLRRRQRRNGTARACCRRPAPCACGRSGSTHCRRGSDTSSAGRAAGPWPRRARRGPRAGVACTVPCATTRANFSSSAICQSTVTGLSGMPPPSSGRGARRVHSTTLSSRGLPEATPSVKGSEAKASGWPRTIPIGPAIAPAAREPARKRRRGSLMSGARGTGLSFDRAVR